MSLGIESNLNSIQFDNSILFDDDDNDDNDDISYHSINILHATVAGALLFLPAGVDPISSFRAPAFWAHSRLLMGEKVKQQQKHMLPPEVDGGDGDKDDDDDDDDKNTTPKSLTLAALKT